MGFTTRCFIRKKYTGIAEEVGKVGILFES